MTQTPMNDETGEAMPSHNVVKMQVTMSLLPCGFCGGPPDLLPATPNDPYDEDFVTCKNPECFIFGNASATVRQWQSRPQAAKDEKHVFKAAPNHELGGDRLCVRCGGQLYDLDKHYTYEEARARRSNIY
jgi:hypothetical protein